MLNVFVLGHNDFPCPDRPFLKKINLRELTYPEHVSQELLCEHAFYFLDLPTDAEYVGFATHRWNTKWPNDRPLERLDGLKLAHNKVFCAVRAPAEWPAHSERSHRGMTKYLVELAEQSNVKLGYPSLYCNNFICHRDVYLDFRRFFLDAFWYFYNKYGYDLDIGVNPGERHCFGYFCERFAVMYFGNQRQLQLEHVGARDAIP